MCLFSVTAAKQKTLMRGGRRRQYIRAPSRLPSMKSDDGKFWQIAADPASPGLAASLLRPVALCSAERTITSSVGLDVFEMRSQSKDLSLGSAAPIQLAPTNKQRGDWTAQNKLFETVGERACSVAGGFLRLMIYLQEHTCSHFDCVANRATDDQHQHKVSPKFVERNTNNCFR